MTPQDFQTAAWKRLEKLLVERLQELRKDNDRLTSTPNETSVTRGRIAEVKRLIDLPREIAGGLTSQPAHQQWMGDQDDD
jgi:hypothetical protein